MIICPRCQQRISHQQYDVDIQHDCNSGNSTLDQEDVAVIGDYVDESTGNTVKILKALSQGETNKFWGTRAGIDGARQGEPAFTARGARASTHRQRQNNEHINLKGGG